MDDMQRVEDWVESIQALPGISYSVCLGLPELCSLGFGALWRIHCMDIID